MEVECIKSKNPNLRLGEQGTNEKGLKITLRSFDILIQLFLSFHTIYMKHARTIFQYLNSVSL